MGVIPTRVLGPSYATIPVMKIPRTVPEFRNWLKHWIREFEPHPELELNVFEDAASIVKTTYRLAVALEQWHIAVLCDIRTPALSPDVARRLLVRCLAGLSDEQPDYLTVKEAALKLGVSERTVRNLVRDGRLRYQRVGSAIRIAPADLDNISQPVRRLRHL